MSNLILDIRISGYRGKPTRLVATVDTTKGLVYVSDERPFKPPAPKIKDLVDLAQQKLYASKTIVITDIGESVPNWNMLYNENNDLESVISAYHLKDKGGLLLLDPKVKGRYSPQNVLQTRKVDAKQGIVWELSTDTTNGHVCVLVACWVALKAVGSYSLSDQLNDTKDFLNDPDSDFMDEPFSVM